MLYTMWFIQIFIIIIINEYYCGAIKCVFTHTHTEYYANVVDSVVFDSVYTVIENKCETV